MASTTRGHILDIIQRRQAETVSGLAAELQLAPATVRRHLDILQRDGLVTFTEIRRGTGRPEFSFTLTERGHESLPKHYADMLAGMVGHIGKMAASDVAGMTGGQILSAALTQMADEAVAEHRSRNGRETGLDSLLGFLEERNYSPEVSETEEGVTLTMLSCPFRSVAVGNPAICQFDTAVVEKMLGTKVERRSAISHGDACCMHFVPAAALR